METREPITAADKLYRPFKDSIFDTVRVPVTGHVVDYPFRDCRQWEDGTPKRHGIDTNMTQCGQLGYPRYFDLVHWALAFGATAVPADIRAVLNNLRMNLHFGGCDIREKVRIHRAAGSSFDPIVYINDGLAGDYLTPGRPLRDEITDYAKVCEQIEARLKAMAADGQWLHYYQPIVKKQAIRIDSHTLFEVDVVVEAPKLSAPLDFKIMLRGLDYRVKHEIEEKHQTAEES